MGSDGCVLNGIQSNWTMSFPNRHCLQRQYSDGDSIGPWVPAEVISSYIQSDRQLADFREHIEFGYHGAVHLGLGGDAATKHAPNDFFFHMHHANIDRLWWLWQNGQNAFFNYNGPGDRGEAQLDDTIPEDRTVNFGRAPVGSVMILGYNGMCYSYDSAPAPPARYPWPPNGDGGDDTRLAMTARNTSTSVLSGSSVMAGHALELVRIHGALKGQGELSEYFPKVASLAPSRVEMLSQTATGKKNCTCKQYVNRAIMYPPRMTEPWIRMHGFDPERVEQVHRDACRLVDLLNDSNYVSPY
ncbi:hypothetical protein GGI02_002203 [Coemansia sp. RSA 2322]|uniref:Tyrosinase copper-binding domain-containing protein n=1 Tax=Coemansia thaxteri TaxID=2663907 RepID=A0A9W8BFC0_9FUNG|nr:hypothetical protein H4R26_002209 [Coemansia thaxteri]KAJ2471544.1 hypothetical protein GGI02_002203 [Coemansia sp. RSA 2322]KAJ2485000.1 hypothetical protein EV174_002030 [Coemansia sp. RSA 2320]